MDYSEKYKANQKYHPDGENDQYACSKNKFKKHQVIPEKGAFTDFAWVNEKEIKKYPCIDGIPKEIKTTIKFFKR